MISVAIDGPAGAGKSSISRAAAKELGFIYVDTGALYRTIALGFIRAGVDMNDGDAVNALLSRMSVDLRFNEAGEQRVILDGEDVADFIRTPEVSMGASDVSKHGKVREYLVKLQQSIAKRQNVIARWVWRR